MAHRYFALQEFLDAEDEAIMDVLPSLVCNRRLKTLYTEVKNTESVSKALQAEDVSLLDARVWFEELITAHPTFVDYIGPRANIVHRPGFESDCVRILKRSGVRLAAAETRAFRPFIHPVQIPEVEGKQHR
ncbi:hypothetical protein JG687_00008505 [Phytophthora cactorum]|uniref:Uncharacterized protein n=1 Tax=Phytophthora cactorum TaxID=29920 RepID=A0A329S3L0_9STRA|nr:hypothetical protein PC112_g15101 [Phytophthora cactorum]KAG2812725.1 hypothetical protein PC111_g14692 [Phytophthora cactorum]KAG2862147.1 hypothetical protein PC113_g6562 [Phytophthora cactorum]KAG2918417.1 hypothetical protein PC114_g6806 [Phytophthora cactorum]KAG2932502.1 hypothetical protein PC115_g5758 [Phytophthora cactorum]